MKHDKAIEYWDRLASNNPSERSVKVNPQNDFTSIDAEFIGRYTNSTSRVLDLASGTGLIVNKYYNKVEHIDAVEKYPEFSKYTVNAPNVDVYNEDILDFQPNRKYDIMLMFGVVQYFSEDEVLKVYDRYVESLKPEGKLIIKNQFGVDGDVEVAGISEEIGQEYVSQYRHIDKEVALLESVGYRDIDVVDIYPPEANRWSNTHFYAVVAARGIGRQLNS